MATAPNTLAPSDFISAGSIGALGVSASGAKPNTVAVSVTITGTWVGTLTFYASQDNLTWQPLPMVVAGGGVPTSTVTANGTYTARFSPPAYGFMVTCTAYTSGTATVNANLI